MCTKEEAMSVLKQFDVGGRFPSLEFLPKASVLIPLLEKDGQLYTLMTLRSKEVPCSDATWLKESRSLLFTCLSVCV